MTMQALARLERPVASNRPFDRRTAPRRTMHLDTTLSGTGDEVIIHDLSPGGLLIETGATLRRFEELEIDLPRHGPTLAWVAWTSGRYFGCEFARPVSKAAVSAALLQSFPARAAEHWSERGAASAKDAAEEEPDDRYSLSVRLRFILGSAIGLWVLILWATGIL